MPSKSTWIALAACSLLALCFASAGCAAESPVQSVAAELRQSLEDECAESLPDVTGDVLAILSSTEPLNPAEPQVYGNAGCRGVIFEFDNHEEVPLHGAWVQASGLSQEDSDALGESRCVGRELQAEYWGYKDKQWTKLAAAEESAVFVADSEVGPAYCDLDALVLHEGAFEKLRIVARVTQESQTYPMHACVW
jgi:hypothetical protein